MQDTYISAGELTRVTDPEGNGLSFGYADTEGCRGELATVTTLPRDLRYALEGLSTPGVLSLGYTVDGAFRVESVTGDRTLGYGCDPAGRLTGADGARGRGSFTYDGSGDRTTGQ